VSVAEMAPRGEEFERTPPHDIAAEQCVLGGMLLSKDAISDVIETISPEDHYRPAHQIVHEVILDLFARGEPADAITVAAELTKRGDIGRVGGAPYLHTLIASVPTAANAGYYARIVRERALLRRLVEVGTRIVQLGYTGDGDADEIVDRAEADLFGITQRRVADDYLPLSQIMPGALDEIEAIGTRGGALTGVPTGFADLDSLTNGLHAGQMIVIAARPALGKALALDTPLPTPSGWTTMGEVAAGDWLIGADGRPAQVTAATGVMRGRPCYEVEFSDGTVIVADAGHQWRVTRRAGRGQPGEARAAGYQPQHAQQARSETVTTAELAADLGVRGRRREIAVALPRAADLPAADLPFPPYALGAWLGGGSSRAARLTSPEPEIIAEIEAEGLQVVPSADRPGQQVLRAGGPEGADGALRRLGVLGDKHIPARYLRASEEQRRALLAGLLDAGGHVTRDGAVQSAVTSRRLAAGTRQLVLSLGYRAAMTARPSGRTAAEGGACYAVTFSPPDKVFRLTRKLARQSTGGHPAARARAITAVRPVPSVPVRCVQVDNADHMYLAGRTWIPTHNSTLALDFARAASIHHGLASVIFSLEMGRNEITMRLLSAEARVALNSMRTGQMNDDDWTRLARRMGEVVNAPLFIDDSPNMSMMEIRSKCRRLKQRHDLKLVIIDYLQLMTSQRRVENRQQEVSDMSRSLKLLAKELEVPVIAVAQLNRGPEQRTDKRPLLADLRESGCLTAGTRILRADTGAEVTLGELIASGARDVPVWSLDDRLHLVPRTLTHAFSSGIKEVFRVRLRSGREVEATASHPFLTYDGWMPLGELAPGSRVAVPRHVPPPVAPREVPEPEVILLAHLIGDGSFARRQPVRYASTDEANLTAVTEAAGHFGITAVRDGDPAARRATLRLPAPSRLARGKRNPIAAWLDSLGLFGLRSHEKFVPECIFSAPQHQVALFLRHLWATDGCVRWDATAGIARIRYASASRRLADDVAQLLLRFGVRARIKETRTGGYRPCYQVIVSGADDQRRFLRRVGGHGAKAAAAAGCLHRLESVTGNASIDTVPREVWQQVKGVLLERQLTRPQFAAAAGAQFRGSALREHAPGRERLGRVAAILDDAELEMLATNDVFWDEIASVTSLGGQEVYDATVPGNANFVANGINLHNSIEQDADVVILLHREDAYEKESPRAGEADFIVAKHRNGPTTTVTVAFQGHYSRFVDMAPV
jgi:replicative DNA helicase